MSLLRDILQKTDSIAYKLKAQRFKNSPEWKNSPDNRSFPRVDWEEHQRLIEGVCADHGVETRELHIDRAEFEAFKRRFRLPPMSLYALNCKEKKMMEHYVAYCLLEMKKGEVYVDIASENSPFPGIFRRELEVDAYSQDLTYEPGMIGHRIGSSADRLPVDDGWIDKASLQCAYEHFIGDIDRNFMAEMARTLKPGGRCVIVPLYTSSVAQNIYDPILFDDWNASLADAESEVFAEIGLGGHFERIYSPQTLPRILIPDLGLEYTLFRVTGKVAALADQSAETVNQVKRIRYALQIEKAGRAT